MKDDWDEEFGDDILGEGDRARVKAELDQSERLLWIGRPIDRAAPLGRGFAVFAAIDAIAWVGAALATLSIRRRGWGHGDAAGAVTLALAVAGMLSCGLALFLLLRRSTRRRLAGTLYALTDRRAILWQPSARGGGVEVHSFGRGAAKRVHRVEYPDGSGDVVFQQSTEMDALGTPRGFEKVAEVVRVERLVREALCGEDR